jgi:hypothetical protein
MLTVCGAHETIMDEAVSIEYVLREVFGIVNAIPYLNVVTEWPFDHGTPRYAVVNYDHPYLIYNIDVNGSHTVCERLLSECIFGISRGYNQFALRLVDGALRIVNCEIFVESMIAKKVITSGKPIKRMFLGNRPVDMYEDGHVIVRCNDGCREFDIDPSYFDSMYGIDGNIMINIEPL